MANEADQPNDLRHAADELQRYLSDDIAPLMAADFVGELLPQSPEIAARVIASWINGQLARSDANATASDLIFHTLRKLYLLAEFDLVPRDKMLLYIQGASRYLIQACPASERDDLKLKLSRLGESETVLSGRADYIHRAGGAGGGGGAEGAGEQRAQARVQQMGTVQSGPGAKPGAPSVDPKTMDQGARALSLLLERMAKVRIPENAKLSDNPDLAPFAQLLATAALEAKSDAELDKHMERVRGTGTAAPMGQVFRALGWNLPGWTAVGEKGEVLEAPAGRSLEAMNRIVALAPNAQERAKRWGEMIYAAIEQLNEGRLAQAVSILEGAKRLIAEKHPDPTMVGQVLDHAEQAISEQVLRKVVEVPGKQSLLRLVLEFFPGLRAAALLDGLDGESRRDRRKLILALVECHGPASRDLVLDRVARVLGGERPDVMGYYARNLAFLLRRIPRRGHERLEEEIALLEKMIAKGQPLMSVKEAIGALGQVRERAAEIALLDRLHELENEIGRRGGDQESWELTDRICAALSRQGTQQSIRAIAAHAFKRLDGPGSAMSRLEHLGTVNLSVDPEQLAILLTTLRNLIPKKVMGLAIKRPPAELTPLVQAVSGTPTDEVRALLRTIADAFASSPIGELAAKSLAKLEPRAQAAGSTEALTGDLELFGLPGLLQSLQGSDSSGELAILDKQQARLGTISLFKGRITTCTAGKLQGPEAAYALFEKPVPGTFSFRNATEPPRPGTGTLDAMQLILEGARRHDEYQRARTIAPDGLSLEPVGIPAMRPEDEDDGELAGVIWDRAAKGLTPDACEHEIPKDPFRVRRLYAFWIEQGALRPRTETRKA